MCTAVIALHLTYEWFDNEPQVKSGVLDRKMYKNVSKQSKKTPQEA